MKIRQLRSESFHAEGRNDRLTEPSRYFFQNCFTDVPGIVREDLCFSISSHRLYNPELSFPKEKMESCVRVFRISWQRSPLPLGLLATEPSLVLPHMQQEHIIRVFVSKKKKRYIYISASIISF